MFVMMSESKISRRGNNMKLLFTLMMMSSLANANVWDGDIELLHDYACLGIDGVPIGNDSALASTCCSDHQLIANAPPTCKAGFNTILRDAGNGAAGGINLAQQALAGAAAMDGNSIEEGPSHNTGGSTLGDTSGEGAASVAGSNAEGSNVESSNQAGSVGSGLATGGGSGTGGGPSLGLGSAGGTSGIKSDGTSSDPGVNGGGYVKAGDGKGKAAGSGSGLGGMFGSLFGGSGGGKGGSGDAGNTNELAFGDANGNGDGSGGANGDGSDGDGKGSPEDPSDYFNRIDKSANIFKIVSARYMKKKSLWAIPQALPEDLKQKKI